MRRIIPAVLASLGFLATFTVRSWHADLWHFSESPAHTTMSAPRQATQAHGMSLASHFVAKPVLRREPRLPAVRAVVRIADAAHFLSERDREANHSARVR